MVRNLPQTYVDGELENAISIISRVMPTHVRVPRDRYTGLPRGFAFIEFPDIATATEFLQTTRGTMTCSGATLRLHYASNSHGHGHFDQAYAPVVPEAWRHTVFGAGASALPNAGISGSNSWVPPKGMQLSAVRQLV